MKDGFISRVGLWGQRHYNFLKKIDCVFVRFGFATKTIGEHCSPLH